MAWEESTGRTQPVLRREIEFVPYLFYYVYQRLNCSTFIGKLVKFESKSVGVESRNYRALSKAFVVRMNCVS